MISYLKGVVRHLDEAQVVVDIGGVGYEVLLPGIEARVLRSSLLGDTPDETALDKPVELWIHYHGQERPPRPLLIGFHDRADREFFELLLTVANVGPVLAAKSMVIPVCEYASAIERQDVRALGSLPGIGKRKADQIIATLKGKTLKFALLPAPEIKETPAATPTDFVADVEAALVGLGYRQFEAVRMIDEARRRAPDLSDAQSLLEEIWRGGQE